MKKNSIMCGLVLSMLLVAGCAQQQDQMSYIGADAAKQAALADCGLTVSGVESITADMSSRGGQDYYQIDITAGGQKYQYDVDALTGVVIEARVPDTVLTEAGTDKKNSGNQAGSQKTGANADGGSSAAHDGDAAPGSKGETSAELISAEDARTSALTHAELSSDQVTFGKSKLEYDNGRQVYEVEFYTQDNEEYDYEIDAYTGEVISYDYEAKGYAADASSGSVITEEKAKELALAQIPGATVDDILKFEVDYENGRTEYEGKVVYDGMKYEFEIDGYSGAIRSWEAEPAGR